jgi:hypothetical protein
MTTGGLRLGLSLTSRTDPRRLLSHLGSDLIQVAWDYTVDELTGCIRLGAELEEKL